MNWDLGEEISPNDAGRKRASPFEVEISTESKRQAVGEGIDDGPRTGMRFGDATDMNGIPSTLEPSAGCSQVLWEPSLISSTADPQVLWQPYSVPYAANPQVLEEPSPVPYMASSQTLEEQYMIPYMANPPVSDGTLPVPYMANPQVPEEQNTTDLPVFWEIFDEGEMEDPAHVDTYDGQLEEEKPSPSPPCEDIVEEDSLRAYDTCFGVVLGQTTLKNPDSEPNDRRLVVRATDNIIRLYKEPDEFVGLIISNELGSLLRDFPVHATASFTLGKKDDDVKQGKSSKAQTRNLPTPEMPTRIVIYGLLKDKDLVGEHLSNAGLYLQHPTQDEYDHSVEYFNPHYLIRPGAQMPRIEDLSLQDEGETPPSTAMLDEVSKAKIWRIFDLASGGEVAPEVVVSPRLKTTLEKHQLAALGMMVEKECGIIDNAKFPTLWEYLNRGPSSMTANSRYRNKVTGWIEKNPATLCGGILADEMGLGKTLSTLALICWYLDVKDGRKTDGEEDCSPTLVVVPKSTIFGWEEQIEKHIFKGAIKATRYHGPSRHDRVRDLVGYDIVLTTYEVLRQDFATQHERDTVYSHSWRRIVLDEAHRIRTRSSQLYNAAIEISKLSQFRWCLTGTPIHNSLDDYAALLSFLQVQGLSEKRDFDRFIATPIKNNLPDGMERLQTLVRATSLRRTMKLIAASLGLQDPSPKNVFVDLTSSDAELYRFFQEKSHRIAKGVMKGKGKGKKVPGAKVERGDSNILSLITFLRFICNYGDKLLPKSALEAWESRDFETVTWPMMQQQQRSCAKCNTFFQGIEDDDVFPCGDAMCPSCESADETNGKEKTCQRPSSLGSRSPSSFPRSAKVEALIRNLRTEQQPHADGAVDKSVVFSCWTKMIDLVQRDLENEGYNLERIDGQTPLDQRARAIRRFKEDATCTVILASIGSAGEGINLTSACHVHILEPQWNPMTESQAIGRVHRFGQKKRATVTRYIVNKSIEKYVQWIQSEKLQLISRSLDQGSISQAEVDGRRWKKLQDVLASAMTDS